MLPACFKNHGNYVVSLGNVCRWLGQQAEALGVEIFPGFPGRRRAVRRERRGERRRDRRHGRRHATASRRTPISRAWSCTASTRFSPKAAAAISAGSCRSAIKLRDGVDPQVYGIGLKELWEIKPEQHQKGLVMHTAGWPLAADTYGGSFFYHMEDNLVAVGFVVGLGYTNPYLNPYEEFQRYKTHPAIRTFLEGGKRIAYGARAISAGGLQSLPKLVFPGGCLIGDDAGFLNASRIKGSHAAMKSGMLAAEAAFEALQAGRAGDELTAYPEAFRASWLHDELHRARNFKPWMSKGLYSGTLMVGIDQVAVPRQGAVDAAPRPRGPRDADAERPTSQPIAYPKPDGVLTFDRLSSVFISNTNHNEDQPVHLTLKDPAVPIKVNLRALRRARAALLPGGRLRDRARCRRHQSAAADQRAELRALQDLRHQGPDAEHRVGHAGRRRRAELPEHVNAVESVIGDGHAGNRNVPSVR